MPRGPFRLSAPGTPVRGLAAAALLLAACHAAGMYGLGPAGHQDRCVVERVIDGDTVVCTGGTRVRLLLIDTPEMDQGPFGEAARDALLALLPPAAHARMEYDVERLDRYGRTLAYLYLPERRMVNVEMARSGYAVAITYPPNVRHIDEVRAAVAEARQARRGLWAGSAFDCKPVEHRRGDCE